jgi:hypothetical protein
MRKRTPSSPDSRIADYFAAKWEPKIMARVRVSAWSRRSAHHGPQIAPVEVPAPAALRAEIPVISGLAVEVAGFEGRMIAVANLTECHPVAALDTELTRYPVQATCDFVSSVGSDFELVGPLVYPKGDPAIVVHDEYSLIPLGRRGFGHVARLRVSCGPMTLASPAGTRLSIRLIANVIHIRDDGIYCGSDSHNSVRVCVADADLEPSPYALTVVDFIPHWNGRPRPLRQVG